MDAELQEDAYDVEAQAAKEIMLLRAEIKEKQERVDKLLTYFKNGERFTPGKYERGPLEIVVSTNQRISETKAKRSLNSKRLSEISVMKVDARKARANLTPTELSAIMDHYEHKIEIRVRDEG